MKPESVIRTEIKTYLEMRGHLCFRMILSGLKYSKGRGTNPLAGFPDLFGVLKGTEGRLYVIEVKCANGKLEASQKKMIPKLQSYGVLCVVAYSLEDIVNNKSF